MVEKMSYTVNICGHIQGRIFRKFSFFIADVDYRVLSVWKTSMVRWGRVRSRRGKREQELRRKEGQWSGLVSGDNCGQGESAQ